VNVGDAERAASVAAGAVLAALGLWRRTGLGLLTAGVGSSLIYRGLTGHCPMYQAMEVDTVGQQTRGGIRRRKSPGIIHVEQAVTIHRSVEELYRYWRELTHLPQIMSHLRRVEVINGLRSRWTASAPDFAGGEVHWEAQITQDEPPNLIARRSVEDAQVPNSGSVTFTPGPGDRGTVVRVALVYSPPAGRLGHWLTKLWGQDADRQVHDDLARFKAVMECGEMLTTEGQPRGQCGASE
jgi:uncharacterized membrane protein